MHAQRLKLAHEFVDAVASGRRDFGVLLSGPNGVGKSAVGLQAFFSCFARRLPVVYIPAASKWVAAAGDGRGDAFFLTELMRQNADLVAADPSLREVLAPALEDGPFDSALMRQLHEALTESRVPAVGVITDEVQAITKALAAGRAAGATSIIEKASSNYFSLWEDWQCGNRHFRRMDIASSHGRRELTLPSGECHRLRCVRPWTAAVTAAAVSKPESPLYLHSEQARDRIVFTSGGIPRTLFRGKERLASMLLYRTEREALTRVVRELELMLEESAQRWWATLDDISKDAAASSMLDMMRGELEWQRCKGAYDEGLVARCDEGTNVTPVSSVAASALVKLLAPYGRGSHKPLSNCAAGADRGHELERQIIDLLADVHVALPAQLFDGSAAPDVSARARLALPFDCMATEVKVRNGGPTLYIPRSKVFACDAVTVPASNAPHEPIVVWEASVTDPRDPERVAKCVKWFEPGGIIPALRTAHPDRGIVCAFCFPEALLANKNLTAYRKLEEKAAAAGSVSLAVVAIEGLQKLGVSA